jgi:hypothetical protein
MYAEKRRWIRRTKGTRGLDRQPAHRHDRRLRADLLLQGSLRRIEVDRIIAVRPRLLFPHFSALCRLRVRVRGRITRVWAIARDQPEAGPSRNQPTATERTPLSQGGRRTGRTIRADSRGRLQTAERSRSRAGVSRSRWRGKGLSPDQLVTEVCGPAISVPSEDCQPQPPVTILSLDIAYGVTILV